MYEDLIFPSLLLWSFPFLSPLNSQRTQTYLLKCCFWKCSTIPLESIVMLLLLGILSYIILLIGLTIGLNLLFFSGWSCLLYIRYVFNIYPCFVRVFYLKLFLLVCMRKNIAKIMRFLLVWCLGDKEGHLGWKCVLFLLEVLKFIISIYILI